MSKKTEILNTLQIQQKLNRMAIEIHENTFEMSTLYVGGINGNGFEIAQSIFKQLQSLSDQKINLFELLIDKKDTNTPISTSIPIEKDASVILIDDVINSGHTMMHAVSYLIKQPISLLKTAVLVDRQHRKFPIKANFVGLSLSTTLQDHIKVDWGNQKSAFLI